MLIDYILKVLHVREFIVSSLWKYSFYFSTLKKYLVVIIIITVRKDEINIWLF